ncbi:sacsin N-terminal ATP-binding-like domain-containing protein [Nocardia sp. NPDC020380]|uniref:sacsin N-terminal ATP-binding-like domain-containing protein n=1 Tax=Nocardia sp. NPDC020380 TaxID=3364309 RepID=UPI0037BB53B5
MVGAEAGDPFGTAALREGVIAAWRGSPTRLREDATTEADLVRSGYRDRLLTELAQNAADAAAKAAVAGRVAVWLDGRRLHVANTGVGLDVSGVHSLTALRASAKTTAEASVGRFGVGFTAVLTVAEEIEFRSGTGSLRFSRAETWALLGAQGIDIPAGEGEFVPPALRLAWPIEEHPVTGFDSEIVLLLREDVDIVALLAAMHAEAVDLLLELPALQSIRIGDDEITSTVTALEFPDTPEPGKDPHPAGGTSADLLASDLWAVEPAETADEVDPFVAWSDSLTGAGRLTSADTASIADRRNGVPAADADRRDGVEATDSDRRGSAQDMDADSRAAVPVSTADPLDVVRVSDADMPLSAADRLDGGPESDADLRDGMPVSDADRRADGSAAGGAGLQEIRISGPAGEERVWWQFRTERARWLVPVRDGRAVAAHPDVLRAPTRSDEELSLPALLIADIPMQPDRRRLLPGVQVGELVAGYADFARALPARDRLVLVPPPGFARSEADAQLREAMVAELQAGEWLPVLGGPDAAPRRASVFTGVTVELAGLLADIVGPLVIPELSERGRADALAVLDVHRIGLARIADLSSSLEREPQWWYSFYDALEPFVNDPLAVEELGALAVPLADGRLVTGPRTVVLDDHLESAIPVHWARLAHPEAVHELLGRLGGRPATPEDLLNDPGLRALLDDDPGDPDTVDAVLTLAANVIASPGVLPSWLGLLELPDAAGESAPADELLLPDAPLARVLAEDAPFTTVDPDLVERFGADALRAIGVGWGFTVVAESDPTGPDHDLDDEETWWEGLAEDPPELLAVRDLDLVDDGEWPEALRLLLSDPVIRPLLSDRNGYTAWWLRHHAHIDGISLGLMRHPADELFAGLLPQLPGFSTEDLAVLRAILADPEVVNAHLAEELLDALADPAKTPIPEAISQTYQLLSEALADGRLDVEELVLPDLVRALSGAVIPAADAIVLDKPWYGPALPADRLVVGDIASAGSLATLLDLPLASEAVTAEVLGAGHHTTWIADPLGVLLRLQFDLSTRTGELVIHDELLIRLSGAVEDTVAVAWWQEDDVTHVRAPKR